MAVKELRGPITSGRVFAIFYKGDDISNFLSAFPHTTPLSKNGSTLKREDFSPTGSNFFPFRVAHFNGETKPFDIIASLNV